MTAAAASGVDLDALLHDVRALVECESPSADLAAVARSAEVVAEVGTRRLGVPPERIVLEGCTHLRWQLGSGPSRVLLLGHHDTVWPLGTLARRPFAVEHGVLRGPGCFDMLAGLAMAFEAAAGTEGVTILVTGDEELGSPTSRGLVEQEGAAADAVLVLEASADGGALKTERKGVSLYDVEVAGRAAHAGLEPERGTNAAVELAHVVLALANLGDSAAGTTVTPTRATAGTTTNTVPAAARVAVDVRARTAAEQQRVDAAVRSLRPVLPGAGLAVRGGPNRPPLESSASAALFARACEVAARLGLPAPTSASVGGASDGNFTAGVGTPTLDGLGAVGGGAHAEDEHVLVAELPGRTALLRGLVADLLDTPLPSGRGGAGRRGPRLDERTNAGPPTRGGRP
ncbi:M20 family metallopeptidase [Microbacterium sp. ARD31]|uniref:M20 family metallopeptidase n=1 Tax=Microbacterium sp. ARD31 TaxID=2962576 RepID=UPI00288218D6|nr:M20 family metallopeptidase [Microbacterium sp. ARD31]MDT0187598.1 M20 family metallopeptidase [Microbacterium sp. ARD31]